MSESSRCPKCGALFPHAKVTTNPLADDAITSAGTFTQRVPIGTR